MVSNTTVLSTTIIIGNVLQPNHTGCHLVHPVEFLHIQEWDEVVLLCNIGTNYRTRKICSSLVRSKADADGIYLFTTKTVQQRKAAQPFKEQYMSPATAFLYHSSFLSHTFLLI